MLNPYEGHIKRYEERPNAIIQNMLLPRFINKATTPIQQGQAGECHQHRRAGRIRKVPLLLLADCQ
jgi:hypothetical protein